MLACFGIEFKSFVESKCANLSECFMCSLPGKKQRHIPLKGALPLQISYKFSALLIRYVKTALTGGV
ncbi:hypothetical protein AGMMS49975_00790 [Clostridia bacterium]|nr:hypothetical protein AGMMS49975_00790 [Clostridia bacterium]